MRLIICVIFSVLATLASVLALPIHLASSNLLDSRDLESTTALSLREDVVPSPTVKRFAYDDYSTLVIRNLILSELRERYIDAGINDLSTHSEHHYPTASQTSRKHHLSRSALRRMRWYTRRRRTQRKLRPEDLIHKHQEAIPPHLLARAATPSSENAAPAPQGIPAPPSSQHKVLKLWKKRIHCRLLNGKAECFKTSRVKPNHITVLDAKGATPLKSE